MRLERFYYVYILTNDLGNVMYIGVTGNLLRRIREHRAGNGSIFTKKYRITRLVYYEQGTDVYGALVREKQLKKWNRVKKDALVVSMNPTWHDLAPGLLGE